MSAPVLTLDSTSDPSTFTVNDNGVLQISKSLTLTPSKGDPGQGFSVNFDIVNERTTAERGLYTIEVDGVEAFRSDLFDINVGETKSFSKDMPGFPASDRGKVHSIVAKAFRVIG